jgi:hypothetical protein
LKSPSTRRSVRRMKKKWSTRMIWEPSRLTDGC